MNKTNILSLLFLSVVACSCLIKSLHPFYKKEDIVFIEDLKGTWMAIDSSYWTIKQYHKKEYLDTKSELAYLISCKEKGKDVSNYFLAHLFMLNQEYYIDFQSLSDDAISYTTQVGTHTLAKVSLDTNTLKLQWYNEPWLEKLIKANERINLKYEQIENSYVLTSSTEDLQRFMIQYGNDPMAFKANFEAHDTDKQRDNFVLILNRIVPNGSKDNLQFDQN